MFPSSLLITVAPYEQYHSINQSNKWNKDELGYQYITKFTKTTK